MQNLNKGPVTVRQCSGLSVSLLNIYFHDNIKGWKDKTEAGIRERQGLYINMFSFAGDQICIENSEHKLQRSIHNLHVFGKIYNLQIATNKTKATAFGGK